MNARSRLACACLVAIALFGCDPSADPVPTTAPVRDPDGATLRRLVLDATAIEGVTYQRSGNVGRSDRVFFGAFEGARARGFLRFAPDSFAVATGGDSLAGATVLSADLSFNCVPGTGAETGVVVETRGVSGGASNAWDPDSLRWPGPALDEATITETTVDNCAIGDDFPERTVAVDPAVVTRWIDDPLDNNGLALSVAGTGALLELASAENNFSFLDSLGSIRSPSGARLRLRAALADGDTVTVFVGSKALEGDVYAFAPDSALLPCVDPADCLPVGRGVSQRALFRISMPDLPPGASVHRAVLRASVLDHPRSDGDLALEVLRQSEAWPGAGASDETVVPGSVLFGLVSVAEGATSVEIPITDLFQGWLDGVFENQGFIVRAGAEDSGVTTIVLAGPGHPLAALRPTLEIHYTTPYGGRP